MIFQKPPFEISFTLPDAKVSPKGLMKMYLGPQYDSKKIADNQEFQELTQGYEYLRAFPVLPLIGAEFTVERDSELSLSIRNLLNQKLPPIQFEQVEVSPDPLRKYLFIDTSVPAPVDEATNQPMAIEIKASLKDLVAPKDSYEYQLYELYKKDMPLIHRLQFTYFTEDFKESIHAYIKHELIAHMRLQIYEAVYSNIQHPNIHGGFYL